MNKVSLFLLLTLCAITPSITKTVRTPTKPIATVQKLSRAERKKRRWNSSVDRKRQTSPTSIADSFTLELNNELKSFSSMEELLTAMKAAEQEKNNKALKKKKPTFHILIDGKWQKFLSPLAARMARSLNKKARSFVRTSGGKCPTPRSLKYATTQLAKKIQEMMDSQ